MSPPPAHSASPKGDDEVASQRIFPDQGEIPEIIKVAPQDDSSAARHMGEKSPWRLTKGAIFSSASNRIQFRRPIRLRNQESASFKRRRCAYSTGDLCPSRGTGKIAGSASKRFHC